MCVYVCGMCAHVYRAPCPPPLAGAQPSEAEVLAAAGPIHIYIYIYICLRLYVCVCVYVCTCIYNPFPSIPRRGTAVGGRSPDGCRPGAAAAARLLAGDVRRGQRVGVQARGAVRGGLGQPEAGGAQLCPRRGEDKPQLYLAS